MPAALGWLAGPCSFSPAAQKGTVKKHLIARHGFSVNDARDAVAALVPIVRRGAAPAAAAAPAPAPPAPALAPAGGGSR
jgi:hypothetical protein